MRNKEVRESLKGLYRFFKSNVNKIGTEGKPLAFHLDGQPTEVIGLATAKMVSPEYPQMMRIRVEFESDVYVYNIYHWILTENGYAKLTIHGHILPWGMVKRHVIIMGMVNHFRQLGGINDN